MKMKKVVVIVIEEELEEEEEEEEEVDERWRCYDVIYSEGRLSMHQFFL